MVLVFGFWLASMVCLTGDGPISQRRPLESAGTTHHKDRLFCKPDSRPTTGTHSRRRRGVFAQPKKTCFFSTIFNTNIRGNIAKSGAHQITKRETRVQYLAGPVFWTDPKNTPKMTLFSTNFRQNRPNFFSLGHKTHRH